MEEEWVHITIHLPIHDVREKIAYLRVLNVLASSYPGFSGFSSHCGDDLPRAFRHAWSEEHDGYTKKAHVLYSVALRGSLTDAALLEQVDRMKKLILQIYEEAGASQDELFCTAQVIHRLH